MANVELLRILSMLMIILSHSMSKSNALWEMGTDQGVYYAAWFLNGLCMASVNCYVIISGFFLSESKFRLERLVKIYFQVLFYSVTLAVVAKYVLHLDLTSGWLAVFLPITRREYWFATSYLGLYCLMPFLNILISAMSQKQFRSLLGVGMLLFSAVPTFLYADNWLEEGGAYGIVWFMLMYLIGAYVRKYYREANRKVWIYYAVSALVIPVSKFVVLFVGSMQHVVAMDKILKVSEILYTLNSLPTLIASVMLFVCFVNMNFERGSRWISLIGGATFGVYLIHNNRNIAHYLWSELKIRYWLTQEGSLLTVLAIDAAVFAVCTVIELLRQKLFKLLRLDNLAARLSLYVEIKVTAKMKW